MVKKSENRGHRVLIVDDCPVICIGLSKLLELKTDLSIDWHGQCDQQALNQLRICKPDLIIAGLQINGTNIFDFIKKIQTANSSVQILVFGSCDGGIYTKRLLSLGASGYIQKSASIQTFLTGIQTVLNGKIYISSENHEEQEYETFGTKCGALDTSLSALAPRELEVFRLIGSGKTTSQIAKNMSLSVKTVETYRSNITRKLSLRTNVELIQLAFSFFGEIEHL